MRGRVRMCVLARARIVCLCVHACVCAYVLGASLQHNTDIT